MSKVNPVQGDDIELYEVLPYTMPSICIGEYYIESLKRMPIKLDITHWGALEVSIENPTTGDMGLQIMPEMKEGYKDIQANFAYDWRAYMLYKALVDTDRFPNRTWLDSTSVEKREVYLSMCRWTYTTDLDGTHWLRIYRRFQKEPELLFASECDYQDYEYLPRYECQTDQFMRRMECFQGNMTCDIREISFDLELRWAEIFKPP